MKKIKPHWQILGALVLATLVALLFRSIDPEAEGGFIGGVVARGRGQCWLRLLTCNHNTH